mmetsp:Transcript_15919/g.34578  ORF Transcript_15919/g.34578 Transcript_15919/m.34578 type:complete len:242 (-) Transcript_15919:84-809(-)|eukprot:CAMPEP_0178581130 /NCGR_PEP_ID=MMETSP0697-20121206/23003_1 /TAXON_ID=265572 /ORGANISM="Extubocellulus spinifer, Strain CCMP396" /LENGTH=241 /DNA_ID=CAMNT_0020216727 /DNA_START=22 /DNA_END=747 /DNA_ORIENTATION=-
MAPKKRRKPSPAQGAGDGARSMAKKGIDDEKPEKEGPEDEVYVWEVCCFPHGERTLLLLNKERYCYWRKHLNLHRCRTWKDVRELGIFDEVWGMYQDKLDTSDSSDSDAEDSREKWKMRLRPRPRPPKDEEEFTVAMIEKEDDDIDDVQSLTWPPFPQKIMYDDMEEWMEEYNTFYSSFSWNSDLVTYDPDRKDEVLEEIAENGWTAEHEPGLADLMLGIIRSDGFGKANATAFLEQVFDK